MKVCVLGLWHLGTVIAACLAEGGHQVVGLEFDAKVVEKLQAGHPPIFEPGLEKLIQKGLGEGRLGFISDPAQAVFGAEAVWIAYDTPVDEADRADVDWVLNRVRRVLPCIVPGTLIFINSQLPVGTTRSLEKEYQGLFPERPVTFVYSPENLRLGRAIEAFTRPDRVVVGLRQNTDRMRVMDLFRPFTERFEWMSVESAEMSKHALNGFLATSVAFINEVASLCEQVGADAKEVERALKSDGRIGPRAYLSPGSPFAGGTLARDVLFLEETGKRYYQPTHLFSAVRVSNEEHKNWTRQKLQSLLGELCGKSIAVWGLTYKPGTDTLRRSASLELCEWMAERGSQIQAHDPAIRELPGRFREKLYLHGDPLTALKGTAALVVATEWPVYRSFNADSVVAAMDTPLVIDPNRFLLQTLGNDGRIRYVTVGKAFL
jgi:UDPglucose 6-dehydrogenase